MTPVRSIDAVHADIDAHRRPGVSEEIVRRSAAFFEERLWNSESGARIRLRLTRTGVEESTMHDFGIGYAPGDVRELLGLLSGLGYSDEELVAAGVATPSRRGHIHALFHARVMFPIRDRAGHPLGFAGLATHLGPSWSLWVRSPAGELFRHDAAIFGIDRALSAISESRRVLVKRDCLEVIRLHQEERVDTVGVIQRPITSSHLSFLAGAMGVQATDLSVVRNRRLDSVLIQPAGGKIGADAFGARNRPYGSALAPATVGSKRASPLEGGEGLLEEESRPRGPRGIVYLGGILIGAGIPLVTLLLLAPDTGEPGGWTPALNVVIVAVATSYVALTLAVSRASAKRRARSLTRRMRLPWARGSGEVQPRGWTYDSLEEMLAGGALVSALVCIVLWMTVGGFFG
jgi:hypothetical protein